MKRRLSASQLFAVVCRPASVVVLFAFAFSAMYFITALPRVFYPYDLDFIEDSVLMELLRFAQGQPVYIAPSIEFVPHVYMPLYMSLGGALFNIVGVGYVPLRLLSLGATLTTAGLLGVIAWRESGQPWLALAGAGLYLGGYRLSGFWYELARVDSLFVALALAGLTLSLYAKPTEWAKRFQILTALVFALAFFTKQTALAFGACAAVGWWFKVGRRAWVFSGTWLGLIGGGVWALNVITQGWFGYHTFLVAGADQVEVGRVFHYLGVEVLGLMAGLSVMALAAVGLGWQRSGVGLLRDQPWLLALGAAVVISGAGRASVGGNVNNLMPVYALLCLAPALLWKSLAPQLLQRVRLKEGLIALAILSQFALGVYNPLRYQPTAALRASGDRLIARIRGVEGEVLVMMHPYYAWLAGKEPAAQIAELWYLYQWSRVPLPQDFGDRIRSHYYAAIISSESLFETDPAIQGLIETYYQRAEVLSLADAPPTLTGLVIRPAIIYRPK